MYYDKKVIKSHKKSDLRFVTYIFFSLGLLLLPFSVKVASLPQFTLGFPFLIIVIILFSGYVALGRFLNKSYSNFLILMILFIFDLTFSLVYSPVFNETLKKLIYHYIGFVIFLYLLSPLSLVVKNDNNKKDMNNLLYLTVMSATILSSYFIIHTIYVSTKYGLVNVLSQRYPGGLMSLSWGTSNVVSSHLIFPFFLALYCVQKEKSRGKRIFYNISILLMIISIFLTLSRSVIVSISIGIIILFLLNNKITIKNIFKVLGIILIAYGIDMLLFKGSTFKIISHELYFRFVYRNTTNFNGRLSIWNNYVENIANSTIFDILFGRGYYSSVFLNSHSAHNIILTTIFELGILGFVIQFFMFIAITLFIIHTFNSPTSYMVKEFYSVVMAGWVSMMIDMLFEDVLFTQQYIIYFWVFLAIILLGKDSLNIEEDNYAKY